ncbi:GNAT family N-acetyltransferase [Anaerosacchariphilus polymeriproducens]|uniref:GNAT family N-acetyltransferase n=1 Tax=Anaerosacchariphilus polymeriproducens TaxID=1812858 RepID=A0A371AR27_9FIRM|nr:GNAT family N-acetyltransferase [Anaerosacchariphilus polymeriproducens]RDU21994.1 GNAT family N-acetyltransferase [Anaerosacchariphilus polymeriproducens]
MQENERNGVIFEELQWDTQFFGVSCAKAVLHRPLSLHEWDDLKQKFCNYQFLSIKNCNSESQNSQLIGKDTSAFLADVNLQFMKKINYPSKIPEHIKIYQAMKKNEQIIDMAEFKYSKFLEDFQLKMRGGDLVYEQWIRNAFEKPEKYFMISKENNKINGFLLYSFHGAACVIELIAVDKKSVKTGIGTSLFQGLESEVYRMGIDMIQVGTQVKNIEAINFYHKVGCNHVGSHQIYHLWNL